MASGTVPSHLAILTSSTSVSVGKTEIHWRGFMKACFRRAIILIAVAGLVFSSARASATSPVAHAGGASEHHHAGVRAASFPDDAAGPAPAMHIQIGRASRLLTGPWRFHLGDDMRWASPRFDASGWETVDLTPAPGAHDGDVGLTDYVPGWSARGHEGHSGYAWYRMHIAVDVPAGIRLDLLAPASVEDVYQVFWNGTLIGGSGDFSGKTPVIYSTRPQMFRVPPQADGVHDAVIAIRVWMRPGLGRGQDAGGIHIPPTLGTAEVIGARYQLEWLQTFNGYIVEVVEPLGFMLLALLAWCFRTAISPRRFVPWLCAALLLTAAYRLNQAVYAWMPYENLSVYIVVHYTLIPLGLTAWIMAWRHFHDLESWRWLSRAIGVIALLSVALVLAAPHTYILLRPFWRVPLAILLFGTAILGLRKPQPDRALTFIVVLLVGASQFGVLEALGVPGIWFPFGVGVSLTQYVYAALVVSLAALLVRTVQRALPNRNVLAGTGSEKPLWPERGCPDQAIPAARTLTSSDG